MTSLDADRDACRASLDEAVTLLKRVAAAGLEPSGSPLLTDIEKVLSDHS